MTQPVGQQEAYVELRKQLDNINAAVSEAQSFAREHKLAMGQPRTKPTTFDVVNPATDRPDSYDIDDGFDRWDAWIGSAVCW